LRHLFLFLLLTPLASSQVMSLNDRQEVEAGRKMAALLEAELPLVREPKLNDYLARIGLRLVRDCGRPGLRYHFRIVQTDEVNSFSLPGGYIYLTLGALALTQSEAEIAGFLAHEIGHVAARQHADKLRRSQFANLGIGFLGPVLGGGMRAAATVKGGRTGARSFIMRFSKENELEADRMAAKNLHATGYDPEHWIRLLRRLNGLEEDRPGRLKTYFRQHDPSSERLENIDDVLATLPARSAPWLSGEDFPTLQPLIAKLLAESPRDSAAAATGEETLVSSRSLREREIAALYAPLFYQGIGNEPRYDYITNFDFDGDWRGDNNWDNAAKQSFPLRAWVYYSVRETPTHFFLHYAAFHPRDYKGGTGKGRIFSKTIRVMTKPAASVDPTGRATEIVLAHENDLEGALVVVEKTGPRPRDGKVVFLETLAHNQFLKYWPAPTAAADQPPFLVRGRRVQLFVEAKGHGIEAFQPEGKHKAEKVRLYTFTGNAEEPTADQSEPVGYNLTSIDRTLWPLAQRGLTETYGETDDYGQILLAFEQDGKVVEQPLTLGRLGSAFRGKVGGKNLARPPWGWFDGKDRDLPVGHWFFDPARTIRRDFALGDDFPVAYLHPWPPPTEPDPE
jgi:Zn-dependent protease with chaperone function